MGAEAFRYDGRHALVVGGATGMGAAVAKLVGDLGAEVSVIDVADVDYPVERAFKADLRDRASVDEAVAGLVALGAPIDAVFSCAGVADGTPGLMLINFIAQRHILQQLIGSGLIRRGGGVVMISSVAGLGWERNLATVLEFLDTPDWDSAARWVDEHAADNYSFSKQAINAYVAREAFPLLQGGVRINAVLPGPTDTPLARANADTWLGFGADYREAAGVDALSAEQVASVMAFLCSPAASGVNGTTVLVDSGHVSSGLPGSFEAPLVKMLLGVS